MFSGRQIRDLNDNQVTIKNDFIPRPPFAGYIASSKGSGKSVLLINTILSKDIFGGKFNQIYIINPTAKLDNKWNKIKNAKGVLKINKPLIKLMKKTHSRLMDEEGESESNFDSTITDQNFISKVNGDLLSDLIEEQAHIIETYGKENADLVLLIYDDTIAHKKFWNSESVRDMLFKSRHYKISILITSQSYKSLPKALRLNMNFICLFYTANKDELKAIYGENSCSNSFDEFLNIFKSVCKSKPFNFLTINYQNSSTHMIQSAFEQFVSFV